MGRRALILGVLMALPAGAVMAEPPSPIPRFSVTGLQGWTEKTFEGNTDYRTADAAGTTIVSADCADSASGLYFEQTLDLAATPRLQWRWRVRDGVQPAIDHRRKSGDDALARVYVVARTGPFPWQARAMNYVWAHNDSAGADWPSPYTSKNHQVALNVGADGLGEWQAHSRDVQADFQRYFGIQVDEAVAIAVMSDCDDADGQARADYGDLQLLPAD